MKVNTDKAITPQPSSNLRAPEAKMNQQTGSNSVAVAQNVTSTGSKQIAHPVQPTKGPIPITGPIRRTPGGIPR